MYKNKNDLPPKQEKLDSLYKMKINYLNLIDEEATKYIGNYDKILLSKIEIYSFLMIVFFAFASIMNIIGILFSIIETKDKDMEILYNKLNSILKELKK
ncbi:MAG: hypothetical protein V1833_05295 [Elusimicrobiota bacterium]